MKLLFYGMPYSNVYFLIKPDSTDVYNYIKNKSIQLSKSDGDYRVDPLKVP